MARRSIATIADTHVAQVGGTHYSDSDAHCPHCDGVIQHWDLFANAPYLIGNSTKYSARLGFKEGEDDMENLLKAKSYLDKQIQVVKAKRKRDEQRRILEDRKHTGGARKRVR